MPFDIPTGNVRVADAGPSHPHYQDTLRWLLHLHRKIPGDLATMEKMAMYDPDTYPPEIFDEVAFLAGQFWYNEGDLDQALSMLSRVRPNTEELFLKAKFLIGVCYVRKDQAKPALEAFKDILRFKKSSGSNSPMMRKFTELTYL